MKEKLRTIGFTSLVVFCLLSCNDEYKDQGLKHPSQLHNIIIVNKYTAGNNWDEILLYYDLKDSTFKACHVNICYTNMFNIKDTIK